MEKLTPPDNGCLEPQGATRAVFFYLFIFIFLLNLYGQMRSEESLDFEWRRMEETSVHRSLNTLCQELNMDEQTATEALQNFTAISNTYTLEVRRVLSDLILSFFSFFISRRPQRR